MTSFSFDSSGKPQSPSLEELAQADKDSAIIAYSDGIMQDGRPYYAYVAVRPSQYQEFHAATAARQAIVLSDYGEIIMGGFEAAPPAHVIAEMRDKYGYDDRFEEKLTQAVLKERAEFLDDQEDNRIQDIVALLKKQSGGNTGDV